MVGDAVGRFVTKDEHGRPIDASGDVEGSDVADPMAMRRAVAGYVEGIHRAYAQQASTFPPAVRGRMPLLSAGRFTVVAAGARNLHVLATTEALGPLRGEEVELPGSLDGMEWTVRFYDPVVLPALGLIDEGAGARPFAG